MADRLMTIRELAEYLNVNERTVLKLAAEGALPAVRVGNQWRFRKAMIDAWLDDQTLGISRRYVAPDSVTPTGAMQFDLASCCSPEHILPALRGGTKPKVIEELAGHAAQLGLVSDKQWFTGALIERENIMPTAIGNGVAFLHSLRRHPDKVLRPFMVLGRSPRGVEFDALDGRLTHLFFVLGLRYDELHLPWLTKLAQMLVRSDAVKKLLTAPDATGIYEVLAAAERDLHEAISAPGV